MRPHCCSGKHVGEADQAGTVKSGCEKIGFPAHMAVQVVVKECDWLLVGAE